MGQPVASVSKVNNKNDRLILDRKTSGAKLQQPPGQGKGGNRIGAMSTRNKVEIISRGLEFVQHFFLQRL